MQIKWVVKMESEDNEWVILSEHDTKEDALMFWSGPKRNGTKDFKIEPIKIEELTE